MTPKMKVGLKSAMSFVHGPGAIRSTLQRESYTETMTLTAASLNSLMLKCYPKLPTRHGTVSANHRG